MIGGFFLMQVKYRESWHTLRAQGYKLTMQDIPFQAAKSSTGIASDVKIMLSLLSDIDLIALK